MLTRNAPRLARLAALAAAATIAPACAVDDGDDDELAELDDVEVATDEQAIRGFASSGPLAGIPKITVTGQADTHTGLLVADGLVLTSSRWVTAGTSPSSVTVVSGAGTASAQTRTGRFVDTSGSMPGAALVQVGAFTDGHRNRSAIDARPSAQLVGVLLRCYEHVGDTLRWASMRVTAASGDVLTLTSELGDLDDSDAGAPCIDLETYTAVAMVTGVANGQRQARRIGGYATWIDGMRNLADTRAHHRSSRLALYTIAPDGTRMCLDIPHGSPFDHAAINAYPCHYGPAQRFWLDYRAHSDRPRLVAGASGRCADVPGGSTTSGANYQQYGCHTGPNQQFELDLWNDAAGGWRLRPAHATTRCLSVEGGPTSVSRPVEQRTCAGTADQRWFPVWNP